MFSQETEAQEGYTLTPGPMTSKLESWESHPEVMSWVKLQSLGLSPRGPTAASLRAELGISSAVRYLWLHHTAPRGGFGLCLDPTSTSES